MNYFGSSICVVLLAAATIADIPLGVFFCNGAGRGKGFECIQRDVGRIKCCKEIDQRDKIIILKNFNQTQRQRTFTNGTELSESKILDEHNVCGAFDAKIFQSMLKQLEEYRNDPSKPVVPLTCAQVCSDVTSVNCPTEQS